MTENYIIFNEDRSIGYLHAVRNIEVQDMKNIHFMHRHSKIYEIIILLNGDIEFRVEGSTYIPQIHDIVIVRPNEIHGIVSRSAVPYERITLHITTDFFEKYNCKKFEKIFLNRKLGEKNLVKAEIIEKEILGIIKRFENYFENKEFLVADAALIQLLYQLNCINEGTSQIPIKNSFINEVIVYINENIVEDILLDDLAKKFFVNKFHLCKSFKKQTGYTIKQYTNYKRVLLAKDYYEQGFSLTNAAFKAGFNSYSNFYKSHMKFIGESPRS